MRTAWRHLRAPPTHFRSRDVINVIFRKTTITPSFFKLNTSSKTILILEVISNETNHENDMFLQKNIDEKRLSKIQPLLQTFCISILR